MDEIVVLDFGSQYSHLICRRIRELSVYAELVPYDISIEELKRKNPKGIILSGGPSSVYEKNAPMPDKSVFEIGIPILGICYGYQLLVSNFGGEVKRANREYGYSLLSVDNSDDLFKGIGNPTRVWMSHGDAAKRVPKVFEVIAHTGDSQAASVRMVKKRIYGVQFHPEVVHSEKGKEVLRNFVIGICKAEREWSMQNFIESKISEISNIKGRVLCAVSGGVDSTVVAVLIHRAIGERLKCVFVDNGLLRLNEEKEVKEMFKKNFKINFTSVDARARFLGRLKGVTDPEEKRRIIGDEFAKVFTEVVEDSGPFNWLAQGTLYPDVIESGVSRGPAEIIKTHHNVGGMPSWMNLRLLEPLRNLYKDEVRGMGRILGIPDKILSRHPFPGPGLSVRIMGEVTETKLLICRQASNIVEEELIKCGLYDRVWQAYAAVGDDRAVGVVGDGRHYGHVVIIRIVESEDAMTADWTRLPHEILDKISRRVTNEVEGVTWVAYAVSSKPPATIEPQ